MLINPTNLSQLRSPSPNFAVQESSQRSRSKKYLVGLFFEILSVVLAFGFGYSYFDYLANSSSLGLAISLGGALVVCHTMAFLLVKGLSRRLTVLLLETVGLLIFFWNFAELKTIYYFAIALALALFMVIGEHESRSTMENMIKFKFRKATHPLITKLLSALVLMGVLLSLPQLQQNPSFFASKKFYDIPGWGATLTSKLYPGFSSDTAHDLAKRIAENQLKTNSVFMGLSAKDREQALDTAADEIIKNFVAQSGASVSSTTPFSGVFTEFANSTLQSWYGKSPTAFLFIWAIVLFFIFRGLGAIVGIVIVAIAFIIYELLLAMNVIHLAGESRLHESIEFSET